jgi:hypothetical protein
LELGKIIDTGEALSLEFLTEALVGYECCILQRGDMDIMQ